MKQITEFEEILRLRYSHLFGNMDCEEIIRNERKKLMIEVIAVIMIFSVLIAKDINSARKEYRQAEFNKKGEIVSVMRPDPEEGSYSFTAKVRVLSETGIEEREYYITIDPAGEKNKESDADVQSEMTDAELADKELKQLISNLNDDTNDSRVNLPQYLENGDRILWLKSENTDPAMYMLGLCVTLALVYRNRFSSINREERRARESIIKELPEFINKLVLLINAGVVLDTAFLKIVDDCSIMKVQSDYFYGRLSEIGRLVSETNASFYQELYNFAKHSGVKELMRITNILMDNISKGDDLSDKLRRENELLWFARKQQAEEKGRLAETKLTMPLMMLLGVLIMVTIAPALMEM